MNGSHMTIIPSNRDRVPACAGHSAAIIGIAAPVNANALLEDSAAVIASTRSRSIALS
jgi:hypothetical protein